MLLYHFPTSPFARRVRLALALKGISVELRDARADAAHRAEVHRLNPTHTVPVLVDGEHVVSDSGAICQYLDRKVPEPPLWPAGIAGAEAFQLIALCDNAITLISDIGMRYYPLHADSHFAAVRENIVGRAQRALAALAFKVTAQSEHAYLCGNSWSAADMAVSTLVLWLEGMPARAPTFPPAAQVMSLGWSLPEPLVIWTDRHRDRNDLKSL